MMMNKALHSRGVDRRYITSKKGERGLVSVKDCVDVVPQGLEESTNKSKKRFIIVMRYSQF